MFTTLIKYQILLLCILLILFSSSIIRKRLKIIYIPESIKLFKPLKHNSIKKIRIHNEIISTQVIKLNDYHVVELNEWLSNARKDSFLISNLKFNPDFRVHIKYCGRRLAYAHTSGIIYMNGSYYSGKNIKPMFDSLFVKKYILD